jgi:NADPH:quinone reductase-like Zn-dependent oxidoreductase
MTKLEEMKAAVRRSYGSPSQIKFEIVETPAPKDNEVLIKVYATTVNRTDCANLTTKPFIMRFVLGLFKPR